MSLQMDVSNPELPNETVQPVTIPEDALADALFCNVSDDTHFPFDWNGWGIGVEADTVSPERRPGESIVAWRLGVRRIVDGF